MGTIALLALRDMCRRWRLMIALGVMVALTVLMVTLLDGYVRSVDVRFRSAQPRLVVQQESTVGEFAGSRIPAAVGDDLRAAGVADPIPEVHAVTGTSGSDAVLIVGVDPAQYATLDPYHLVSGRHLRSGESGRTAIVGASLARRFDLGTGDTIRLRGRDFAIVGVFELGTYVDDAAIVPLADAQRLLGWGDEVSLYVIPVDGPYVDGALLPGGLVVAQRGDVALVDEWGPLIAMLTASVRLLALGAVAVMAVALWRLAWLHRIDFGLLRLVGFSRRVVAVFLSTQAVMLVAISTLIGALTSWLIAPYLARTTLAVTTGPEVDSSVLARSLLYGMAVLVVALAVPLIALSRRGVGDLVQRDD